VTRFCDSICATDRAASPCWGEEAGAGGYVYYVLARGSSRSGAGGWMWRSCPLESDIVHGRRRKRDSGSEEPFTTTPRRRE